ncbi:NUDIX hydrolase [Bifidobacterium vespertilionis]|uniref:NUDIX domain-containing protein n=1 Tax=Bifidobacterium vespertilionis TaxID=2562524 RepID=A0A5J5E1J6_9BIFI|nr:NUDIX domain-containing protein [Bifidobacterium vespertilionis]KAA8820968.1 NUDIX domain-containing protein [Bifidobacterium vespertilionis]KAA8822790.1 NUDIX domain-containing protein [Bifidobacterium vespertilionis]
MALVVEAAGGILYRWRGDFRGWTKFVDHDQTPEGASPHAVLDEIEVCVVHRPRYDDWTWPKGRVDPNETPLHAAVREIGEETGMNVELGAYIGEVEYALEDEGRNARHGKAAKRLDTKHVRYWMATPLDDEAKQRLRTAFGPIRLADREEIDSVVWLPVFRARRILTHPLDRDVLDQFVDRVEEGAAFARTVLLVRHAKAEARKTWNGTDADRPITPRGAAAAYALGRELACYNPSRLVSSPWRRCQETLKILSWQTGMPLENADPLTEDAFAADPDAAWECFLDQIKRTVADGRNTAICMHRPVIGGIFAHLRTICATKALAKRLISSTPYMPTGTAIMFSVVDGKDGPVIINIQKVTPIVY